MKAVAVVALLAVVVATAYGAAIEAEKPVEVKTPAEVSPIRAEDAVAAAPKEDLKGAESAYAVLPYHAPLLPYSYPYYRYPAYPYAYPYALPATYYLRR